MRRVNMATEEDYVKAKAEAFDYLLEALANKLVDAGQDSAAKVHEFATLLLRVTISGLNLNSEPKP